VIRILKILFLPVAIIIIGASLSGAYYSSSVDISDNTFNAGTWYEGPDVVINEMMWMGSWNESGGFADPNDEWIELKNMTSSPIDISNWQLTRVSGSPLVESLIITIPASQTIPANGYYLITKKDKINSAINVDPDYVASTMILSNSTLGIRLYKGLWTNPANLIEMAGNGGAPLAGLSSGMYKKSMARNLSPGDGTLGANWYATINPLANDLLYWKVEGSNYGTPGGSNV
jgi:hypothetical protein